MAKRSAGSVLVLRPEVSSSEGPSRAFRAMKQIIFYALVLVGVDPWVGEVGQAEWWELRPGQEEHPVCTEPFLPWGGPLHDQTWVKCVNAPIPGILSWYFFFSFC